MTPHGWRSFLIDNLQDNKGLSFEDAKRIAFDKEYTSLNEDEVAMCSPHYKGEVHGQST